MSTVQTSRRSNERITTGGTYPDDAKAASGPTILVMDNGSKWAGQEPDSVEQLFEMLGKYALDPMFENYGNFYHETPISAVTDEPLMPTGWVSFWGNFQSYSHLFHILTNDADFIAELLSAIRANQSSEMYAEAKRIAAARSKFWKDRGHKSA